MVTKPSKFSNIFQSEEEPVIEEETKALTVAPIVEQETPPQPEPVETPSAPEQRGEKSGRTGRPVIGKKSNPNYRQVTAYVRRTLYREVSEALYDDSRGRDTKPKEFSELVDELLEEWRDKRNKEKSSLI